MGATKITIHWDGNAPGLAEHRLNVEAFGPALLALMAATRRIASGIFRDALGNSEYGSRGGRLAKSAKLDLELVNIGEGSDLCLDFEILARPDPSQQTSMPFDDLPERTVRSLFTSIEMESRGKLSSAPVRKFLSRLPSSLRSQRYEAQINGETLKVEIGLIDLPDLPEVAPFLMRLDGTVIGVGFDPGPQEVRISVGTRQHSCPATTAQVEKALRLREKPITALILCGSAPRLLWIRGQDEAGMFPDPAKRADYLFTTWAETLSRLAK